MLRTLPIRRVIAVQTPRLAATRTLTTTRPAYDKSATDTVKDGVEKVNRAAGDVLVDGIDKGIAAKDSVKDAAANVAPETQGEAKGKASEILGGIKGKVSEMMGQGKGKAEEAKGAVKGAAEEVKGKM